MGLLWVLLKGPPEPSFHEAFDQKRIIPFTDEVSVLLFGSHYRALKIFDDNSRELFMCKIYLKDKIPIRFYFIVINGVFTFGYWDYGRRGLFQCVFF